MTHTKKRILAIIIIMTGFASLHAQNSFTIRGHLKSKAGEPVPFANVALYDSLRNLVTGGASDVSGDFILSGINEGRFTIEIQFVGYDTWSWNNVLINKDFNLGSIVMQESSQVLNEVVIRGEVMERPFEVSAEGITINPAQNLSNVGGSVIDVNLPFQSLYS